MLSFSSAPAEYQYIFNELKDAYLGVRACMQALEEFWMFLVEAAFSKLSHGYLIFED